jgi:hypothetical protein
MTGIKSTSIRAVMMDMLKTKFGGFSSWNKMEADLAILCADLPEDISDDSKLGIIAGLKAIKDFLLEKDILLDETVFIDDEIERLTETKQISLYVEEDDQIDDDTIEKYSRLSVGTEGVMGIHLPFNYSQLSKLTNGVFDKTGLIKFYISREKIIYGKIVAEIYEHPQKIPIAKLIESKKKDKETGDPVVRRIALFGERVEGREYYILKEIGIPFYVYRFITEKNRELILFTVNQCEIGDYIITGVITQCDDFRMLTQSAKLPTKLPFFFAQHIRNRVIKFKNHDEFKHRIEHLDINMNDFFDFPFTIEKRFKSKLRTVKLKQPTWFKWLIWAWLTHINIGMINEYPLHILMLGNPHSGKSILLNSLHEKSKETRGVFSGSSSTLKILRCMVNTRTTKEGSAREESVATMNDLLEHQKREAGSGVSSVHVNMTSRVLSTSNPVRDIRCIEDLLNSFEASFLSRLLIYYQTDEHEKLIRHSKDSELESYKFKLSFNDWISFIDYLQSFPAEYDMKKVEEIHGSIPHVLSETLKRHYDARHMHHIECIMDGIVKARCFLEGDMSFKANENDYNVLAEVWINIIRSWIKPEHLKKLDVKDRIFYLPENCQYLYWQIEKLIRPIERSEAKEIALKAMSNTDFIEALMILVDMGVLIEDNHYLKPHFMGELNEKQQRLPSGREDEEVVQGEESES